MFRGQLFALFALFARFVTFRTFRYVSHFSYFGPQNINDYAYICMFLHVFDLILTSTYQFLCINTCVCSCY